MYKNYQSAMNKITAYMKENDFELSREKTCLMLFNKGEVYTILYYNGELYNSM